MNDQLDPRVDAYITDSAEFARPILEHLRKLIHQACPEAKEGIKWNFPFFIHHGNLCYMASFKSHCGFGFWTKEVSARLKRELGKSDEGMGQFGRITTLADLPKPSVLLGYIKDAAKVNEAGKPARKVKATATKRPELAVPEDLATALSKNKTAAATFTAFSPSHRREYIEWITEAKRPETRERRLAQTLDSLKSGKSRNAAYERP